MPTFFLLHRQLQALVLFKDVQTARVWKQDFPAWSLVLLVFYSFLNRNFCGVPCMRLAGRQETEVQQGGTESGT